MYQILLYKKNGTIHKGPRGNWNTVLSAMCNSRQVERWTRAGYREWEVKRA
jgi:hypothetical protein